MRMENNVSRCLVTGGAGFIAPHLGEAWPALGDLVRALDNLSTGYVDNLHPVIDQIEFIKGDIQDKAVVQQTVSGVDFVIHLAAMVSKPQSLFGGRP